MSARELTILGTASQVPTRTRNHNGYLLRFDDEQILFDPGEGTQRQLTHAGVAVSGLTRICLTHLHGDHSLGLPGVVQRLSLENAGPVHLHYPASGAPYVERLRHATAFHDTAQIIEDPLHEDGQVARTRSFTLSAQHLDHRVEAFGYRIDEHDGHRMLPDRLAAAGVDGPDVGRLLRDGAVDVAGRTVRLDEVSEPRPGQRVAFIMDTQLCPAVPALADGADLLIIESTFLHADVHLAERHKHLTARQAAQVAADAGVRRLVLTHFSQRYDDPDLFRREAEEVYDGEVVVAEDLMTVPVPARRTSSRGSPSSAVSDVT
jgi:ribonuclease Z